MCKFYSLYIKEAQKTIEIKTIDLTPIILPSKCLGVLKSLYLENFPKQLDHSSTTVNILSTVLTAIFSWAYRVYFFALFLFKFSSSKLFLLEKRSNYMKYQPSLLLSWKLHVSRSRNGNRKVCCQNEDLSECFLK